MKIERREFMGFFLLGGLVSLVLKKLRPKIGQKEKEALFVKDIRIGTHGLYLVKDGRSGIFLPQVPVEGWDLATYLDQLCLKAGLPKGAWKEKDAQLSIFTADVVK